MIYYLLCGFEWEDGPETYMPDQIGCQENFSVKFSKEQHTERLRLIFIDMFKAKYADSRVREERIEITNIFKSNSPFEEVDIDGLG